LVLLVVVVVVASAVFDPTGRSSRGAARRIGRCHDQPADPASQADARDAPALAVVRRFSNKGDHAVTEVIVPLAQIFVDPADVDQLDWQHRALCAQTDPDAFFPDAGGSTRSAKRVCRSCEVRTECLEYALDHDERFGVWGGMSERERRRLKSDAI
jgi:WhiB family redox-sensing transcriptional regulator